MNTNDGSFLLNIEKEFLMHSSTIMKKDFSEFMVRNNVIYQHLLTFKYSKKDMYEVDKLVNHLNKSVSLTIYGQRAYRHSSKNNRIKWLSVNEHHANKDGLHVHLLIRNPNTDYMKQDYKTLSQGQFIKALDLIIKEEWRKLRGGVIGGLKVFESEIHLLNTSHYLMKQFKLFDLGSNMNYANF